MSNIEKKQIISAIGFYYFLKNNKDVQKANEEINLLKIHNIDFKNNIITIKLERPGVLIGRRGENIDNLTGYLCKDLQKDIQINIVEELELQNLRSFEYVDYDYPDIDEFDF